jgi:FixJ family two-component response regulator
MRLLKRIFGWNNGQSALIWGNKKQIAPQFTSKPLEEEDLLEQIEDAEEETIEEVIEPEPVKTEVKLGRKTYIVEDLTARDIKKLQQDWGKGKLRSLGIIK